MRKLMSLFLVSAALSCLLVNPHLVAEEAAQLQLAFERDSDICIINIDGTDEQCLMQTDDVRDYNPVWSPDGEFLAFYSYPVNENTKPSTAFIYSIGKKITKAVPEARYIYDWSPDGRYLLTIGGYDIEKNLRDIAIVRPDGSDFQILTDSQNKYSQPAWSPDGNRIAYLSGDPEGTLMVMSATGQDQRALTDALSVNLEVQPQWSPDSKTLAFAVGNENGASNRTSEIYTIRADGSDLQQLTDLGNINSNPRWSPDGTQLIFFGYPEDAFTAERSTDPTNMLNEIYRIDADGSNLLNLTQNPGLDVQPTWSPDGEWIAFGSTRTWESEAPRPGIFIMRPDGSDLQMITNEPTFVNGGDSANNPVWRPIPNQ